MAVKRKQMCLIGIADVQAGRAERQTVFMGKGFSATVGGVQQILTMGRQVQHTHLQDQQTGSEPIGCIAKLFRAGVLGVAAGGSQHHGGGADLW